MSVVLITGYPRLLARELAFAELAQSQHGDRLIVLVRPEHLERARQVFAEPLSAERMELLKGDPASIDLGLSGADYLALRARVTHVHHAEAPQESASRKQARRYTVAACRELLELVREAPALELALFHSTVQVFGPRTGWLQETSEPARSGFAREADEQMALAELMVQRAQAELPLAIARSSFSGGHARTGEYEPDSGLAMMALLCLSAPVDFALPLPGRGDRQLNFVPIDWVAAMGARIVRCAEARGGIFHLVDPEPPTAAGAFALVARAASRKEPRGFLPANLTRALLRAPGLSLVAEGPRAFFEAWVKDVRYATLATQALLGGDAPACPVFEEYVERVVARVAEDLRKRRPEDAVEDSLL